MAMTGKISPIKLTTLIVIMILVISGTHIQADDEHVYIDTEKTMTIGASSEVKLVLQNINGQAEISTFEGFDQFEIISTAQSSQATIINGKRSTAIVVTYYVVPYAIGDYTFTIGVTVDGTEYLTEPYTVTVEQQSEELLQNTEDTFIVTKISNESAYFGEPIILTYDLYTVGDLNYFRFTDQVTAEGTIMESAYTEDYTPSFVDISGVQYKRYTINQALITPTTTGLITIPEFEVYVSVLTGNNLKPSDAFYMNTNPSEITINPLPEDNKPKDFNGLIGSFDIESSYDSNTISLKEPLTLNVSISGTGNVALIDSISQLGNFDGFTVYENDGQLSRTLDDSGLYSLQTYELLLVPKAYKDTTIKAIEIPYFNTITGTYDYLVINAHDLIGENTTEAVNELTTASAPLVISQVTPALPSDDVIEISLSKKTLAIVGIVVLALISLFLIGHFISRRPKNTDKSPYLKKQLLKARKVNTIYHCLEPYMLSKYKINIYTMSLDEMKPLINDPIAYQNVCEIITYLEHGRYHHPDQLKEIIKKIATI